MLNDKTEENDNDQASKAHHMLTISNSFFSRSLFTFTHSFRVLQEMLC